MFRHGGRPHVVPPGAAATARIVQRAGAELVFTPQARTIRPPPPSHAVGEELVAGPGGAFHVRSTQRHTLITPTGTFNFVRVSGDTPRSRPVLVSSRLAHAQIAAGRPVIYAGTARFDRGALAWWSNYSGTYQPIAAFRDQAGLPDAKFVPWQALQNGGTAMQRGTFTERRPVAPASPSAGPGPTTIAAGRTTRPSTPPAPMPGAAEPTATASWFRPRFRG